MLIVPVKCGNSKLGRESQPSRLRLDGREAISVAPAKGAAGKPPGCIREDVMDKVRLSLSVGGLLLVSAWVSACGSTVSQQGPGQLQSIAITPLTADAQNYPNGQVPFVATGIYVNPPHTVIPQSADWGACQKNAPTGEVSVTSAGVAQCASGAAGTYTVFAYDMTNCTMLTSCGGGCTVVGTAQLTCP
jgi:hypothetical protein